MKSFSLKASLLRQYCFCPRIPYYDEVIGARPPQPLWVKQGVAFERYEGALLRRRTLDRYGLVNPRLSYSVMMTSERLGLHGIADVVAVGDNGLVVLEIKIDRERPSLGQLLQLAAYGLMAEEVFNKPCLGCCFLKKDAARVQPFINFRDFEGAVIKTVNSITDVIYGGRLPSSAATADQCTQCEFLNLCNDRF